MSDRLSQDKAGGWLLGWLLRQARALVPVAKRLEWMREWQAELWQLRHGNRRLLAGLDGHAESWSLARGLLADALWLRWDDLRGSAALCLAMLGSACIVCAAAELVAAGSWAGFGRVLGSSFTGGFVFVAAPALVVAMATYPLRPLKSEASGVGWLSLRARWNLFLGAKVLLTLLLGFLATVIAMQPVRQLLAGSICAPWTASLMEMLVWALAVTAGLRWALLNQEQRCQRCLKMLSEPTRVGPPSRNFLDWNGTELVCAQGHGLLHVPEMQGSWCWFDVWVERDAVWQEMFQA